MDEGVPLGVVFMLVLGVAVRTHAASANSGLLCCRPTFRLRLVGFLGHGYSAGDCGLCLPQQERRRERRTAVLSFSREREVGRLLSCSTSEPHTSGSTSPIGRTAGGVGGSVLKAAWKRAFGGHFARHLVATGMSSSRTLASCSTRPRAPPRASAAVSHAVLGVAVDRQSEPALTRFW
jgi:hypothetical protein